MSAEQHAAIAAHSDTSVEVVEEGGASSERAIRCPRCGGVFLRRARAANPFLDKSPARITCGDCGLDADGLARYRALEPW